VGVGEHQRRGLRSAPDEPGATPRALQVRTCQGCARFAPARQHASLGWAIQPSRICVHSMTLFGKH
jgi:hypothetical protein